MIIERSIPAFNGSRDYVTQRLRLDASAGQAVPEDVWLRLAAVLAATEIEMLGSLSDWSRSARLRDRRWCRV
jgi:hypothetical protein